MPSSACSSQLSHTGLFLIAVASSALAATGLEFGIHQSGELTCGTAQLFCLPHAAGSGINSRSLLCYSEGDSREFYSVKQRVLSPAGTNVDQMFIFAAFKVLIAISWRCLGFFFVAMIAVA